jgi:hypothetical protein
MGNFYDVAIIGAGPSGIAAAIYAAKNGVNTVLIEKDSIIGGSAIKAQVHTLCAFANDTMDNLLSGISKRAWNRTIFHPEELVDRYYYQLKRYSVDVLCEHSVISVEKNNDNITSVLCLSPDGKKTISAKVFIDSSAVCAIEELTDNREDEGQRLCYITALIGKVETIGGRCYSEEAQDLLQDSINHAKYTKRIDSDIEIKVSPTVRGDIALLQVGANVQNTDMGRIMREHLNFALKFLQEFGFGYENVSIISSSKSIFYSGGSASKSKYALTYDDVVSSKNFDNSIISLFHNKNVKDGALENRFTIPYNCQLSTAFDNLLYCGRTIGMNSDARQLADCIPIHFETGKAAGIAASIAVKKDTALYEVPLEDLRSQIGYSETKENKVLVEEEIKEQTDYIEPDIKKIQQVGADRLCNFMPIDNPEQEREPEMVEEEQKPEVENKYLSFAELDRALQLLDGTIVAEDEDELSVLSNADECENQCNEDTVQARTDDDVLDDIDNNLVNDINVDEQKNSDSESLYDGIFSCYDKFEEIDEKNSDSSCIKEDISMDKRPKHMKDGEVISGIFAGEYNADNEQTIRPEKHSAKKTDEAIDKLKKSANSTIYDDIFGLDLNYGE